MSRSIWYSVGSLRQQTHSNIVLVDDDQPIDCDQYAQEDDRIRVLHLQNGEFYARNNGKRRRWLIMLDSDDYYDRELLTGIERPV